MNDTPATKADLQNLSVLMQQRFDAINIQFDGIHQQFERVDQRFLRVHEDINRVLDVLVNVDKKLTKKTEHHEVRLLELEKAAA